MTHSNCRSFMLVAVLASIVESAQGQICVTGDENANTACGTITLQHNTGFGNTALGQEALSLNTTGIANTASGVVALVHNTIGNENTAYGAYALWSNTVGTYNIATGVEALFYNTVGIENVATGFQALYSNTNGNNLAAYGTSALYSNTSGSNNTAFGTAALLGNTTGANNTASGYFALYSNTTGVQNNAFGMNALYFATGSNNIALGYEAGYNLTTGNSNIDIGNEGVAADSGAIRIGTAGTHKEVFIAGIHTTKITGSAVYVTSSGRLGVMASSERYKTAIEPMGANTAMLGQLRPVKFKLKTDAEGTLQYGLVAEEVARVYPELVTRDAKGRIDGVRYEELAPMLLNEMQKQQRRIDAQDAKIRGLEQQVAALVELPLKDQLVAHR